MNKAELISAMAAEANLSKVDTRKAVDALIKVVTDTLVAGEKVNIVGFGAWTTVERNERMGVNPSTKAPIIIDAKKVAKFKPGIELSDAVNGLF